MPISSLLKDHAVTLSMAALVPTATLLLGRVASVVLCLENQMLAAWLASLVLVFLRYILAPMRRLSGRGFVKYGSKAAYYGPSFIAFYAANAVFSAIYHNTNEEPTPGRVLTMDCALALLWLTLFSSSRGRASVGIITAYSLREAPSQRWRFLLWAACLAFLNWQYPPYPDSRLGGIGPHVMMVLGILAYDEAPESVMDCQTKEVADYMKRESNLSSPFFDGCDNANSLRMDCCRYPFMQQFGHWITVKDLMQRDDLKHVEDRDMWLSFSLSRLLARRYYGFRCAEEGDANVRAFALAELPSNCNRAFTIVEVQLAFLHDYFFTSSFQWIEWESRRTSVPWIINRAFTSPLSGGIILMTFYLTLRMAAAPDYFGSREMLLLASWWILVVTASVYMDVPVQYHLPKYWGPVVVAFHEVNCTNSLFVYTAGHIVSFIHQLSSIWKWYRLLHAINYYPLATSNVSPLPNEQDGPSECSVYWSNKIGQYSILQDYYRPRSRKKEATARFQENVLSQPSYSFIRHLPEQEEDSLVPQSVRELVARALVGMQGGLPTNGTRSLHRNKTTSDPRYDWTRTCREEETHTDTILIWHIATCYCGTLPSQGDSQDEEHEPDTVAWYHEVAKALSSYCAYLLPAQGARQEGGHEPDTVEWYKEAATALSGYCAYLVAFLPEFLPEHTLTTKVVFQRVLKEAQVELAGMPHIGAVNPKKDTTFHKGVRLGQELEALHADDPCLLWKVIAEFWAETIVYIAPSDNAEAHMEHLAKGGEFITHVWALLSNAGILKRATQDYAPPPPDDTAAPSTSSSSSKGKGIAQY